VTLASCTAQAANRALEERNCCGSGSKSAKHDQQLDELYRIIGERAVACARQANRSERVLYDAEVVDRQRDPRAQRHTRES